MSTLIKNYLFLVLLCLNSYFLIGQIQSNSTISEEKLHPIHPVLFSAGPDALICNDEVFITQGFIKIPITPMWQSSGDGYFMDSSNPITTYTPGPQDILYGFVSLTLQFYPMGGGGNGPIQDTMILYISECEKPNQL